MTPVVLSRLEFSVLSPKASQELTFIIRISGSVDEISFVFDCRAIYISCSLLSIALICRGVSLRLGRLSYTIPAFTSKVSIFMGRFNKKVLPHLCR